MTSTDDDDASSFKAEFECPLCLKLLYEPATSHCGHSFCRRCAYELLIQSSSSSAIDAAPKCPICRASLDRQWTPSPSIALGRLLQQTFPSAYATRQAETVPPLPRLPHECTMLPLFMLEPLLPGQRMFLHVFEIRYRLLIQRALARHDRTFGMMGRMTNYGCQVEILQCRELHDGRFFVEIKGTSMFHIKDKRERDGYWEASVEPLLENENTNTNDNVEDEDDWKELAHQTIQLYQKWEELVITNQWEQQKGQMQDIKTRLGPIPTVDEPLRLALWIAAAINPMPGLGVAREIRLAVVAASSHKERLELLRDTLNLSIDKTVSKKQRYDIRILFFLLLAGYFLVHRYWGRILYFLSQMPFLEEALLGVFRFVPNMHGDSNGEMGKLEAVIAGGEL